MEIRRDFRYRWSGSANQLLISDTLYGDCISAMHSKGYLVEIPTFESNGRENSGKTRKKVSPKNIPKDSRRALTQDQIDDAIIVLATRSGGSYSEGSGSRNTCTLHYGAYFFKNHQAQLFGDTSYEDPFLYIVGILLSKLESLLAIPLASTLHLFRFYNLTFVLLHKYDDVLGLH